MADKIFVDGLFTKVVTTKYWEIVKIGVKVEDFKKFMEAHENNWFININMMTAKDWNKKYFELDTWKPEWQSQTKETKKNEFWDKESSVEDIPF
jgi:hypothetical protein